MRYVEIYKLQNNGDQQIVAICRLVDGTVVIEGPGRQLIKSLEEQGIKDYANNKILFPKDGLSFLEQLKYNFKSAYLNASELKEE